MKLQVPPAWQDGNSGAVPGMDSVDSVLLSQGSVTKLFELMSKLLLPYLAPVVAAHVLEVKAHDPRVQAYPSCGPHVAKGSACEVAKIPVALLPRRSEEGCRMLCFCGRCKRCAHEVPELRNVLVNCDIGVEDNHLVQAGWERVLDGDFDKAVGACKVPGWNPGHVSHDILDAVECHVEAGECFAEAACEDMQRGGSVRVADEMQGDAGCPVLQQGASNHGCAPRSVCAGCHHGHMHHCTCFYMALVVQCAWCWWSGCCGARGSVVGDSANSRRRRRRRRRTWKKP